MLFDTFFIAQPRCGCSLSLTHIFLSFSLVGQDDDLPRDRADTTVNIDSKSSISRLFNDVYHMLFDNFFIAQPRCGCLLSLTHIFLSFSLFGQDDNLPQVRADTTVKINLNIKAFQ